MRSLMALGVLLSACGPIGSAPVEIHAGGPVSAVLAYTRAGEIVWQSEEMGPSSVWTVDGLGPETIIAAIWMRPEDQGLHASVIAGVDPGDRIDIPAVPFVTDPGELVSTVTITDEETPEVWAIPAVAVGCAAWCVDWSGRASQRCPAESLRLHACEDEPVYVGTMEEDGTTWMSTPDDRQLWDAGERGDGRPHFVLVPQPAVSTLHVGLPPGLTADTVDLRLSGINDARVPLLSLPIAEATERGLPMPPIAAPMEVWAGDDGRRVIDANEAVQLETDADTQPPTYIWADDVRNLRFQAPDQAHFVDAVLSVRSSAPTTRIRVRGPSNAYVPLPFLPDGVRLDVDEAVAIEVDQPWLSVPTALPLPVHTGSGLPPDVTGRLWRLRDRTLLNQDR